MASADEEEAMQGSTAQGDERILVSVRLRPLNDKEASRKEAVDWECIDDNTIIYNNHSSPERSLYPNSFTFDRVFRCHCSTRQVYEGGAKAVVLSAVSGINSSVFAYGQTSSGKTFTMSGITEYTMEDIFDYINKHKERDFHLKFSAMEIYNESVRDLLTADNSPLRLLDDPERGTVVEKLTEESLRDWLHFKELLAICEAQRQIGETFLNEASSRSHQILRLTIESSTREFLGKNNRGTLAATLNFVDLAGSERASQALSAGSRLKEGSHINRSLLTLGTVIRKLSKGQTGHVPYRDSKLTRILQSSLGGNARTAVICTMSPARSYVEQSRNTLLFASCAKEVTTDARVNVVMSDKALVKHLQRELVRLESELRSASPSGRSDATEILKEKDFKIEELETRVKELTLRLDLALSQIHNLQQGVEEQRPVWEEASTYPMLHVRNISEGSCSNTTTVVDHHSFSARSLASENPQSPDRHSRLSYDENYSVSDIDENQNTSNPFEQMFIEIPNDASPSMHIQTPVFVGLDHQGFREQTPSVSEADQGIVTEEPERQNPNLFKSDQYIVSEEPEEQNPNLFKSDQYLVSEEPEGRNPNLFKSDQYIDSEEPEGRNPNLSKSDQYIVSEEPQVRNLNSFQSDQYIITEKPEVRNPNSFESDQYIISEEPERHNLNSFESDQNIVSEESERHNLNSFESDLYHRSVEIEMENCDTFEIHLHQDSDGYGSQSPYYVELDPYHVSGELREQTPNSFEANQYHVSDEMVEIMHKYDAFDPQQTPEAVREQDTTVEEYCKEVQCIESEISQGNLCSPEEERKSSLVTSCENAKHTDEEQRQATESGNMNFFLPQCCEVTSTRHQIDGAQTAHEIQKLNCVKDSSQSNDTSTNTSSLSPAEVKYEIKNENGDEECIRRLEQSHGKLSTLKTDVDYGVPHIFNGDMVLDETKVADITVSDNIDDTDERHTSLSVKKEITEAVSIDQVPLQKFQDEDTHNKSKNSIKNMKDVGLNPQDDLEDRCPWSTDVSKLQREIIDLWDACNVPLVHRTYFLLLFVKDDQADTIYMEVERRRLSHIKDAFSRGNSIVLDGCQLTPGSSKRSLHSERKMLSKLMKRRFSSQERLDLYVRWGINLDSKKRSSQLAHRLWVNTVDMDHVMESAKVVAKLIRFSEPQVPKEVFGLNLTRTQGPRKSFKWACTNNVLSEVNH